MDFVSQFIIRASVYFQAYVYVYFWAYVYVSIDLLLDYVTMYVSWPHPLLSKLNYIAFVSLRRPIFERSGWWLHPLRPPLVRMTSIFFASLL